MFFHFGRYIRRSLVFFVLLLMALGFLKQNYPRLSQQVGRWITGEEFSPVTKAVSSLVDTLSEKNDIRKAVEVFYENITASEAH